MNEFYYISIPAKYGQEKNLIIDKEIKFLITQIA